MTIKTLRPKHNKATWNQIRYFLIGLNSFLFWGWAASDRADAAGIPYATAFAAMGAQVNTFISAAGGAAIGTVIQALLVFVPWILLILASSIVVWQVYEGYKEYERENLSGMVKPALNIVVLILFIIISDRAVTFITTGT